MKGKIIVLEGGDGSGKTVQTQLLIERLKKENVAVETIEFPQYGNESAKPVEAYLNGKYGTAEEVGPYAASLFFAVDRAAAKRKIVEWLEEGKIVVCNRYVPANKAHQGGKIESAEERGRFFSWVDDLEYEKVGLPKPDRVFFLHVPAAIGQKLVEKKAEREYLSGKQKDIHEEDINHLRKAEEVYKELVELYDYWEKISCVEGEDILTREAIHEKVWEKVKELL